MKPREEVAEGQVALLPIDTEVNTLLARLSHETDGVNITLLLRPLLTIVLAILELAKLLKVGDKK